MGERELGHFRRGELGHNSGNFMGWEAGSFGGNKLGHIREKLHYEGSSYAATRGRGVLLKCRKQIDMIKVKLALTAERGKNNFLSG